MKNHIILTASLMLCLCHVEAQQPFKVSASLAEQHAKEFSAAGDIRWNQAERVTFAQFKYQNQFWVAYYDNNEQLLATARKIADPRNLPIRVAESIKEFQQRRAAGTKVVLIYELMQQGNTRYLTLLDGQHEKWSLMIDSMGGRSSIEKSPKGDFMKKSDRGDLLAKRMRQ